MKFGFELEVKCVHVGSVKYMQRARARACQRQLQLVAIGGKLPAGNQTPRAALLLTCARALAGRLQVRTSSCAACAFMPSQCHSHARIFALQVADARVFFHNARAAPRPPRLAAQPT